MRRELPQMQAQGGGAIVNTASIAGLAGLPTSSAYVAAKHGVVGLTKTAALEYAEANIRVNAVCPGYIRTRMTEPGMQLRGEAILAQTPFKRLGSPEEIAEMVLWLCSERASYVSGAYCKRSEPDGGASARPVKKCLFFYRPRCPPVVGEVEVPAPVFGFSSW